MIIPIILDEDRLCNMIIKLSTKYCEVVGTHNINILEDMEFHNLESLIESFRALTFKSKNTIFIGFVPPIIAYTLDTYFSLRNFPDRSINLFLIPLIDREIPRVEKNVQRVFERTRKLYDTIETSLIKGKKLEVFWNNSDSFISLEPPKNISSLPKRAIRIEDGTLQNTPQYIPIGEIRIDFCRMLEIGARMSGKIKLRGEPIVGLKIPSKEWLNGLGSPEATFIVDDQSGKPVLILDETSNHLLSPLDESYICQLHIGILNTTTRAIREIISPILTRTRSFLHFWIINRKHKTYHQLIIKNAEIRIGKELVWRTIT